MPARVTMVKKRLADGEPCRKCVQAEELLRQRGHWDRIAEVVWADESDELSPGMNLARQHGVDVAPFFLVHTGDRTELYTSVLKLIKERFPASPPAPASAAVDADRVRELAATLASAEPLEIVRAALDWFGAGCAIAFSGAEDVALIDMAKKTGLPFSCFSLDTGRLHPETYRFIDRVREHYELAIELVFPNFVAVEGLVRHKGLFSFYEDGHGECCAIRKVEPLKRKLGQCAAWVTGQRKDQSPVTRSDLEHVHWDLATEPGVRRLVKFNPLANWSSARVWQYLRDHDVPYNSLHQHGFVSIGCEPCTRAVRPGEHERAGRWWWEEETQRECGLHIDKL